MWVVDTFSDGFSDSAEASKNLPSADLLVDLPLEVGAEGLGWKRARKMSFAGVESPRIESM